MALSLLDQLCKNKEQQHINSLSPNRDTLPWNPQRTYCNTRRGARGRGGQSSSRPRSYRESAVTLSLPFPPQRLPQHP
jgi:hypothetical protein